MPNATKDLHTVDEKSYPYVVEINADIDIGRDYPIRCNVYRPKGAADQKYPVLVTYGPYGKDVPYSEFHPQSFSELNPEQQSEHSAWETPSPNYWTQHGYAIVRADERGLGQSPGFLDTMSKDTAECFAKVIEWAADQPWSTGKVGLLGVSYYAGSQWRVAARQPKGLAAMIPWEGMSDYYRDRCRHGGILSDAFIHFWWHRQVLVNQYGRPGRAAKKWGPDTLEGNLPEQELESTRRDQNIDNANNRFRDDEYYSSKDYNLEDIKVPLLSVGNWGGILLHLRGNVEGFTQAGSKNKWLRFIVGRHDLPFYYKEQAEFQRGFLDAFLKGDDRVGWTIPGKIPPVSYTVRKGDIGYNNPEAEKAFEEVTASAWPLPNTEYTKLYLTPDNRLLTSPQKATAETTLSWEALGTIDNPKLIAFTTPPFEVETEITGHVTAHLNVSISGTGTKKPSDMDLFVTLRHISSAGTEVLYTGTVGDPVPLTKGWLRVSLRKTDESHRWHRDYLPYRQYKSSDVQLLEEGQVYSVDVEIWPTNVVVEKGARLAFEVSSGDTQGSGLFLHQSPIDRNEEVFAGMNHLNFGPKYENYVTLPYIK